MKCTIAPTNLSTITSRSHRGFSLLEIVTSLTIMSLIVVAMGSAMLVATRGLPDPDSPLAENVSSAQVIDQIASELQYAFTVNSASSTGIDFVVERNGAPVTIKYSWSGIAGDPLVRQYNANPPVNMLASVADFNLSYDLDPIAVYVTLPTEGAEIELVKHDPATYLGLNYNILVNAWLGQYFKPILPVDALSWRVTRVVFRAKSHGPIDGQTLVQIRTVDAGNLPSSTIVEQSVMNEADLGLAYAWRQFIFSGVSNIAPSNGLYLVLQRSQGVKSATVEYVADPTGFATTINAGLNWVSSINSSLIYYVYGKVTMPGQDAYPIRTVKIGLNTIQADTTRLQTTALLFNQPVAPITP